MTRSRHVARMEIILREGIIKIDLLVVCSICCVKPIMHSVELINLVSMLENVNMIEFDIVPPKYIEIQYNVILITVRDTEEAKYCY